jgi:hypothetical protein
MIACLRDLGALCVSAVSLFANQFTAEDAEDAEGSQRIEGGPYRNYTSRCFAILSRRVVEPSNSSSSIREAE